MQLKKQKKQVTLVVDAKLATRLNAVLWCMDEADFPGVCALSSDIEDQLDLSNSECYAMSCDVMDDCGHELSQIRLRHD